MKLVALIAATAIFIAWRRRPRRGYFEEAPTEIPSDPYTTGYAVLARSPWNRA